MRIMGIDPSSYHTGVGVIEVCASGQIQRKEKEARELKIYNRWSINAMYLHSQTIRTQKNDRPWYESTLKTWANVAVMLAEWRPGIVVIEVPSTWDTWASKGAGESGALLKLARCTGGLECLANMAPSHVTVRTVHPQDWKGQTDKGTVQRRIQKILHTDILPHDEAEACGMALYILKQWETGQIQVEDMR